MLLFLLIELYFVIECSDGSCYFDGPVIIVGTVLTVLMFVWNTLRSRTFAYLLNSKDADAARAWLEDIRKTKPEITWIMTGYRQDSDRDGTYLTITHRAVHSVQFGAWTDESTLPDLSASRVTMVHIPGREVVCDDPLYHQQMEAWKKFNSRGEHRNYFQEIVHIPGLGHHTRRLLSYTRPRRWFVGLGWFAFCQVTVVLAIPYRIWLNTIAGKEVAPIVKKIHHVAPMDPALLGTALP